ncbi:hypothetical protein NNC19_12080 [Clostridium sp. SHJSY1]|nr:hypothetical protein [Clostridium sp. SHJSY1]MDS0526422.1 hypothetical protein [Clostridium sp. SHJSY1]
MNTQDDVQLHKIAKDMIIAGEPFEKIMEKTHLRLKDLKRIQSEEIDSHF